MNTPWTPKIVWEEPLRPVGEEKHPEGKLLGRILIAGVPHHIEAWELALNPETNEQEAVDPFTSYDAITNEMIEGAGWPVHYNGRDYFMVVTPFEL